MVLLRYDSVQFECQQCILQWINSQNAEHTASGLFWFFSTIGNDLRFDAIQLLCIGPSFDIRASGHKQK